MQHFTSKRFLKKKTARAGSPAPGEGSNTYDSQNIRFQRDAGTTAANKTIPAKHYAFPRDDHQSTDQGQVESSALSQRFYTGHNINYGNRDQNINSGDGTMIIYNAPVSAAISKNEIQGALEAIQYSYRHNFQARFPQPKCSEGTRKGILEDLLQWAHLDPSQDDLGVCWLRGSAGTGKSAIAQTMAEECEGSGLLVSFFFSRTDPNRNTTKYLALAIADALITAHPTLREIILQVVNNTPAILHMTLEAQFKILVVEPLLKWRNNTPEFLSMLHIFTVLSLVIIDGLDECLKPVDQKEVLSLVLLAMKKKLPILFLICSRPEPHIRQTFHQQDFLQFTKHVSLNGDSNVNQDIRTMLCTEFNKIRNSDRCKQMNFPSPWPSDLDLQTLVDKASGQFIYPATILKFIDDEYSHPCVQLQLILSLASIDSEVYDAPPYHDLDILYMQILQSAAKDHQKLLRVVAAVLLLQPVEAATPERIEQLLVLHSGDVALTLHKMHSLLHIKGNKDKITVYHASFVEFLYDHSRSKDFFIDQTAHHQLLVCDWLSLLLRPDIYKISSDNDFMIDWKFAKEWINFCLEISQANDELAKVVNTGLIKLPHIFCMLWNRCPPFLSSLLIEELDVIVECLQYLSGIDPFTILESIQVSADCKNIKGLSPTICLEEVLHCQFQSTATYMIESDFPMLIPLDGTTCVCHAKLLAEPILRCNRQPTIFHISIRRAIAELLQSELNNHVQTSATSFTWDKWFLKYGFTDSKLLPYSGLIQLMDFQCNWMLEVMNHEYIVLEWLKAFPPVYSELVQPHINEVTRMIDMWEKDVNKWRELGHFRAYEDWENWKNDRIGGMAKPIYSSLKQHIKHTADSNIEKVPV